MNITEDNIAMDHYKSWNTLNKQLTGLLCDELKDHISFFLTCYHKVHNSYGRVAIRLDNNELVCFSWINTCKQEHDISYSEADDADLKKKWDENATYSEMDFLEAATSFLKMPVREALQNDNFIVRILAVIDRRIGKRTLRKIQEEGDYKDLPDWVKQFYELRINCNQTENN